MEKDAVKKHVESCDAHKEAIRLSKLADMRVEGYMQDVLDTTPIGRGMKKMISADDKTMTIKFNTAYYLAKKERDHSVIWQTCSHFTLPEIADTVVFTF